ncbi:MAG: NfeD family protein [Eubacteriales bacterium]
MSPSVFWLIIFILFTVGEAVTEGLTSIWFALGAFATLIAIGFGAGITTQAVVFLTFSALSMILLRPMAKNYLKPHTTATNADRLIGTTAMVTETIDNIVNSGEVQINGQYWSATSAHDVVIPDKSRVKILEIQGVKLIVEVV